MFSRASQEKANIDARLGNMEKESFNYLNIYYEEDMDRRPVELIKDRLPKIEKQVEDIFGEFEKEDLNVIFYNNEEDFKEDFKEDIILMDSSILIGYYQPNTGIHLSEFGETSDYNIESVFRHEYSHYAFHLFRMQNNIFKDLPIWFDEGIATYLEGGGNWEHTVFHIKDAGSLKDISTYEEFHKKVSEIVISEDGWYDPYMHGYYVVDYLINEVGKDSIKEIILESKDMEFDDAFEEVVGVNINEFEENILIKYIEEREIR